jgi:hypothetical protein
MPLKVIGTGFGRTGTDSMREALNILGLGPCHHMGEVLRGEEQRQAWRAVARGESPDWERLFEGYTSCMDWPSAHYWRELIAAYPDAKVILTSRSAESWWASFEKTILRLIGEANDLESFGRRVVANQVFGGRPHDRAHAMAVYEAHRQDVIATVPADRLLVHELGDGWEPLCRHLGVPVPDQPYPSRNNATAFQQMMGVAEDAASAAHVLD